MVDEGGREAMKGGGNPDGAGRSKERVCPVCSAPVAGPVGGHIRRLHGEDVLAQAVLGAKGRGMPDAEIGERFGVSFNYLERVITRTYGANVSSLGRPKRVRSWGPGDFRPELTTVWSFRQRGNWATHDGRYRGNWSPYIPRNVILRYSRPGDVVLDYFVGSGTTAVEAKLLGRRCIARDVNPEAVRLTRENLCFPRPSELFPGVPGPVEEPQVEVGDARELRGIGDGSVDLICAHPPYAGIIKYSSGVAGDLSELTLEEFLAEMGKVAAESLRALKPGGVCVILIGDSRKAKKVVPIGFQTIQVFLETGFSLQELVIKRQHNCKTTGFWYRHSVEHNFLLLAHEYLPVFRKPPGGGAAESSPAWSTLFHRASREERMRSIARENLETTTVWVLPRDVMDAEIKRNLAHRFVPPGGRFVEIGFDGETQPKKRPTAGMGSGDASRAGLVYVSPPPALQTEGSVAGYRAGVRAIAEEGACVLGRDGLLVLDVSDVRIGEKLWPLGMLVWQDVAAHGAFATREIVVVVPAEEVPSESGAPGGHLRIVHRYVLIFTRA